MEIYGKGSSHHTLYFFLDCGFIIPPQSHGATCTRIESGVAVGGFPWLPSFLAREGFRGQSQAKCRV